MSSCLDGVPVHDKAFPLGEKCDKGSVVQSINTLEIVGHCPKCDAPVYGQKRIRSNEQPTVKHSCECYRAQTFKNIQDTMHTK